MKYSVIPEKEISEIQDRAIRDVLVRCFPADAAHFARQREWHSPQDWTVTVVDDNSSFCGCIAVIEREINVGGCALSVAGIGNVCVLPEFRGQGIIDSAMACMADEAKSRGLGAGLLFCKPALVKVYERMGWKSVVGKAVMRDENGAMAPVPDSNSIMSMPLSVGSFPDGDIDLMGRDW